MGEELVEEEVKGRESAPRKTDRGETKGERRS